MTKRLLAIGWLGAILAIALGIALARAPAHAQVEPGPRLTYSKVAGPEVPIGAQVSFTLRITNSGDEDAGSQTVQDILPEGIEWSIHSYTFDECSLTDEGQKLVCNTASVPEPAIVGGQILNGAVSVTVTGFALQCGDYDNLAIFQVSIIRTATARVTCPPTPTPTPTNTPVIIVVTATPTATPVVPTATPASPTAVLPTASPRLPGASVTPGPPNTGESIETVSQGANLALAAAGTLAIVVGATATSLIVLYRRRRE